MTSSKEHLDPQDQSLSSMAHSGSVGLKGLNDGRLPPSLIQQISPASLAYIGDAVYELYVRTRYLLPPRRLCDYHNQVVAQVRAEQQALNLQKLEPYLTESEQDIVRRGRNAAQGKLRRLSPHLYQQASSLETLIGYLYLQDPHRLEELLEIIDNSGNGE